MRSVKRQPLAYLLHSFIALKLSAFLAFVCLTGTIATVSHEIEWLVMPQVRATSVNGPERWGAMWDAVRAAYPNDRIESLSSFDRNGASYLVRTARMTGADGASFDVHVDPGTARVTGEQRGLRFHSFMRGLHYYLFAPGDIPFYLVSSLGIVLLLLTVTGLITYKRFWRGAFKMPRWRAGSRQLIGDLHRLAGLWTAWFALIIGLTTCWYIVEWSGLDLENPAPRVAPQAARSQPDGRMIDLWVAQARAAMPGLGVSAVNPPDDAGGVVSVQGQWRAWLVRERTNTIYLDPVTSRVVGRRDAGQLGVGERIVHTADPLHFGNFGGLATKLVWVVFGLLLTGLAVSGAAIFAKRTHHALGATGALATLNYLGGWKWPTVAAVLIVPTISFFFAWQQ